MLLRMGGSKRTSASLTHQMIFYALVILFLCFLWATVADAGPFKAHRKFAKHLYKFVRKEKKFFKKKGIEAAVLLAMSGYSKKKIPFPVPLPIPIVHQPIIHEPVFFGGKFAEKGLAKGAALDLLTFAKTGGVLNGAGGFGGHGGIGHLGLGGIGLGGII